MHLVLLTNFNLSGYALYHLSNNRSLEFCLPSDVSHIYTNATSPDLKKSSKMAKTVSWTLASALKPKLPLSSVRKNWYIPSFFIISSKTKPAMYCRPASVTKLSYRSLICLPGMEICRLLMIQIDLSFFTHAVFNPSSSISSRLALRLAASIHRPRRSIALLKATIRSSIVVYFM